MALLTPMIATSGALMIGVETMPPSLPRLVIVIVEPLSSLRLAVPSRAALRDAADLRCQIAQRQRLGVMHDRNLESVAGLRRDAQVHAAMLDQHVALGVVTRVALREALDDADQRQPRNGRYV